MQSSPNYLFSKTSFHEYQRNQRDQMEQEISELSSTELETSDDSLALIFSSKYSPSPIQLHEPIHEDIGQVEKTTERLSPSPNLPHGGKVTKKVQRLKLKIPYTGERQMLHTQPTSHISSFPTYDELTDSEIVHYVDYQVQGKDSEEIKNKIDNNISRWHDELEEYVNRLNKDIRKMQNSFEKQARRFLEDHRDNMDAKDEALAELGISTQNVEQGFVEPEKKKELELPDLPDSSSKNQRIRDRTFVDILDIIDSMRISVEQAENTVRDLDEESLRTIFLGAINSHYGNATAESFNRGGKTDILLRHQGVNLFVAECKFWTGEKGFHDAVDQLLGNLTADDSHAALLIFSTREKLVTVQNGVEEAVEHHDSFHSSLTRIQDHNVYQFQKPSGTEAKIAVKVVDLQQ